MLDRNQYVARIEARTLYHVESPTLRPDKIYQFTNEVPCLEIPSSRKAHDMLVHLLTFNSQQK